MPFCTSCGNRLSDGDRFCARCGAPVVATTGDALLLNDGREPARTPVEHKQLQTDNKPSRRSHRTAIVVALVVAAAIALVLALVITHERSHQQVAVVLSVNVLPTSEGISGATPPTYPRSVTVHVPQTLAHDLAAYGVANTVIVAPKGWREVSAVIGADGNEGAALKAGSDASIPGHLQFLSEASGQGGHVSADAAEYFSWVRSKWVSWQYATASPSPAPGLVEVSATRHQVRYLLGGNGDLQTSGVAEVFLSSGEISFANLQVTLPKKDSGMANVMLRFFAAEQTRLNGLLGASSATRATPKPQASETTPASAELPGINDSVTFYDSTCPDFRLVATVNSVKKLPTEYSAFFQTPKYICGVKLTIENTGNQSYDDDVSSVTALYAANGSSLSWTSGEYTADGAPIVLPDCLAHVHILPGETVVGWVYFESDNNITPLSFQFAPNDTQDDVTFKPGEWQL